jgi:hypothetical protein
MKTKYLWRNGHMPIMANSKEILIEIGWEYCNLSKKHVQKLVKFLNKWLKEIKGN